jgi:rhamnulose-1-phosphate aldolase/alcohol dehydrogenase
VNITPHSPEVDRLIERSHRLGADRRTTNFAGGNTSAKATVTDPLSGDGTEVLWVKGSGGDLGTLTESGLAVLSLDRLHRLVSVYTHPDQEDDMVAALDLCLWGRGGAAPSIDTAMHGLVAAPHVDHLHPESGLAFATAADGEELTRRCFGDRVLWVPWRRPGFQLGMDIALLHAENPQAIGAILGGHGITAWGATSEECEANSLEIISTARDFLAGQGKAEPFGSEIPEFLPLPEAERRALAARLLPVVRGLVGQERPQAANFTDDPVVLDFLARAEHPRLAALGTSCPDHFLRTKIKPLVLDVDPREPLRKLVERLSELHAGYRADYQAYYDRHADPASPPMRGADPTIVLLPGIGMISLGRDAATARVAGEYYINAINAMRGAESVSTYAPIPDSEKFRVEYWELEEAKLRRMPPPARFTGRVVAVLAAPGDPLADVLTDVLPGALRAEGAVVTTIGAQEQGSAADAALAAGGLDAVVLIGAADPGLVAEAVTFLESQGTGGDVVIIQDASTTAGSAARAEKLYEQGIRVNRILPGSLEAADQVVRVVAALAAGELAATTGAVVPVVAAASGREQA